MGYAEYAKLAEGVDAGSLLITRNAALKSAASMPKTTEQPTLAPEAANGLTETAARAQEWAGEPFLRADEDPAVVLAPGTARRLALDDAVDEMDAGRSAPSYEWKRRYALMLGLERVLTDRPPRLASGTELRKHQIDALAGMLTELIATAQAPPEPSNGNGNGAYAEEVEEEEEDELEPAVSADGDELPLPLPASHRVGKDDCGRGIRRGRADARRPHPDPPPPARLAVQPRPDHRGLRRPDCRRRRPRSGAV